MLLPAGQQLCNLFVILMQHEILQIIKENYVNIKCLSLPVNLKALICLCIYRQLTVILCYESIGHMIIFLYQNFISVHMNYEIAIEKYRSQTDHFQIILLSISRPGNESFVCWKNLHSSSSRIWFKIIFFVCVQSFSKIRIYQYKVMKLAEYLSLVFTFLCIHSKPSLVIICSHILYLACIKICAYTLTWFQLY